MRAHHRARAASASLLSGALLLAAVAGDASRRRAEAAREEPAILAVGARLPSSDLALSGGARWLRSPSLEEPSAAFDVGPAMLDPDPAGGLLAPPGEAWALELPVAAARRAP